MTNPLDRRALFALPLAAAALASVPARASEHGEGGAPAQTYIAFPTLTATIFRPTGQRGVMTVEAGVDAIDPALHTRAQAYVPRLRAAYTRELQTFASALLPASPPDVDRLCGILQAATDQTLGRRGARFLVGTVIVN